MTKTTIPEAAYFNQLAASWDNMREINAAKLTMLIKMIGIRQEDAVLDLGSGTGVLLPYLSPLAKTVTAVDFASEMLAKAREKFTGLNNVSYVVADILSYKPQQRFDKITCMNFYPHIRDKGQFIERVQALLKPEGEITILHDISRQKVNAIHGGSKHVENDRLKPAEIEAA
ncbi:MAG: class I SAM-dependent methyltransferase, partial [Negativicutes bacterium]|nr:class I SAM-dependent methyltransferase [Negativicutes bacterium]